MSSSSAGESDKNRKNESEAIPLSVWLSGMFLALVGYLALWAEVERLSAPPLGDHSVAHAKSGGYDELHSSVPFVVESPRKRSFKIWSWILCLVGLVVDFTGHLVHFIHLDSMPESGTPGMPSNLRSFEVRGDEVMGYSNMSPVAVSLVIAGIVVFGLAGIATLTLARRIQLGGFIAVFLACIATQLIPLLPCLYLFRNGGSMIVSAAGIVTVHTSSVDARAFGIVTGLGIIGILFAQIALSTPRLIVWIHKAILCVGFSLSLWSFHQTAVDLLSNNSCKVGIAFLVAGVLVAVGAIVSMAAFEHNYRPPPTAKRHEEETVQVVIV